MLLGRLSPAPPDEALMDRLRAARPRPRILRPLFWMPLAAAAALVMAFAIHAGSTRPSPHLADRETEAPKRVPVASRQHLMEVADIGVTADAEGEPVRLIRTTWLDEIYYETSPDGEPEKESQLREEVMPVAIPIY